MSEPTIETPDYAGLSLDLTKLNDVALSHDNLPEAPLEGRIVDSLPIPPSMYHPHKWLEWLPGKPA